MIGTSQVSAKDLEDLGIIFFLKMFGNMYQKGLQNSYSLIHKFYLKEVTWRNNWCTYILMSLGRKIILVKFGNLLIED